MNEFFKTTSIPSDFVYTGKLFYGILDMIKNSLFPYGSNILLIHSGGLQGNLSLPKGTLIF
jgi:1-aminocyclopropane-1-carboxylate deaminase/D-cysteine desulfhydrase-like pyridoxal-dependent ACC family enzyme